MTVPEVELTGKDVVFVIKNTKNQKIGELMISVGNLTWKPKGNEKNVKKINWTKFAELVEFEGKNAKLPTKKTAKKSVATKTNKAESQ